MKGALTPLEIRRLRLQFAGHQDAPWLADVLSWEGKQFGTQLISLSPDDRLEFRWRAGQ